VFAPVPRNRVIAANGGAFRSFNFVVERVLGLAVAVERRFPEEGER